MDLEAFTIVIEAIVAYAKTLEQMRAVPQLAELVPEGREDRLLVSLQILAECFPVQYERAIRRTA